MEEPVLRLLTLTRLPGFGPRRIASLVRAGGVQELYETPERFSALIGEAALELLKNGAARAEAEDIHRQAERLGQSVVALGTAAYPPALAALYDPPSLLFMRGSLKAGARRVAIQGGVAGGALHGDASLLHA